MLHTGSLFLKIQVIWVVTMLYELVNVTDVLRIVVPSCSRSGSSARHSFRFYKIYVM